MREAEKLFPDFLLKHGFFGDGRGGGAQPAMRINEPKDGCAKRGQNHTCF
jgi:hypothetical protein